MAARRPVRRSTRLLQTLAVALFALGVLLILPIPFWADALQSLRTFCSRHANRRFSWNPGLVIHVVSCLVTFTLLAWAVALIALIQLVLLIVDCVHHSCQGNPVPWIIWLAAMLTRRTCGRALFDDAHLASVAIRSPGHRHKRAPRDRRCRHGADSDAQHSRRGRHLTPRPGRLAAPAPGAGVTSGAGRAALTCKRQQEWQAPRTRGQVPSPRMTLLPRRRLAWLQRLHGCRLRALRDTE